MEGQRGKQLFSFLVSFPLFYVTLPLPSSCEQQNIWSMYICTLPNTVFLSFALICRDAANKSPLPHTHAHMNTQTHLTPARAAWACVPRRSHMETIKATTRVTGANVKRSAVAWPLERFRFRPQIHHRRLTITYMAAGHSHVKWQQQWQGLWQWVASIKCAWAASCLVAGGLSLLASISAFLAFL